MITDIADGDIPVEMLRWITTWGAGAALAQVLTFAASSSMHAVPLWQSVGAAETGQIGAGFGTIANYPAAMTNPTSDQPEFRRGDGERRARHHRRCLALCDLF